MDTLLVVADCTMIVTAAGSMVVEQELVVDFSGIQSNHKVVGTMDSVLVMTRSGHKLIDHNSVEVVAVQDTMVVLDNLTLMVTANFHRHNHRDTDHTFEQDHFASADSGRKDFEGMIGRG